MADLHINENKGWQYKWESWEDEIIKEYYPKNGYKKVLELLPHRNKSGIQGRASKIGVKYITYDKDYFENIDSNEKAYWLGFLFADGYVTTNNRWGLELCEIDLPHLCSLLSSFKCNIEPKIRTRNKNKSCSFQINNKKMYSDLIKDGVVKNKTEILKFPTKEILQTKYYSHFIRGFFDGDGCVTYNVNYYERKDRNNRKYNNLRKQINIVCKSKEFIEKLKDVLKTMYDINFSLVFNKRDQLYSLQVGNKNEIIKFSDMIYNNSSENSRLNRKYNKFQELLCHLQ